MNANIFGLKTIQESRGRCMSCYMCGVELYDVAQFEEMRGRQFNVTSWSGGKGGSKQPIFSSSNVQKHPICIPRLRGLKALCLLNRNSGKLFI